MYITSVFPPTPDAIITTRMTWNIFSISQSKPSRLLRGSILAGGAPPSLKKWMEAFHYFRQRGFLFLVRGGVRYELMPWKKTTTFTVSQLILIMVGKLRSWMYIISLYNSVRVLRWMSPLNITKAGGWVHNFVICKAPSFWCLKPPTKRDMKLTHPASS